MSEHPSAIAYREATEKYLAGDAQAFADMIADDVVWHQIGSDQPLRGKQALMESMQLLEGVEFALDTHDVLANDEHLVALVEATVTVGDESFTYRTAEIAHIVDGKVTERWAFSDDTERINRFFAQFD